MTFITNTLKENIMPSCCLQTQTDDVYEHFYEDKNLFDLSDYPQDSKLFDPVNPNLGGLFRRSF